MADVIKEIKTAITEFCRAQVISKGGDRFALEGKNVTAIYVNAVVFFELCNKEIINFDSTEGIFKFGCYQIFRVDGSQHPRVRVV